MKHIVNFTNKFKALPVVLAGLLGWLFFASCDNELDIQAVFPFEVSVMPVPNEIKEGQTVEIRFNIQRAGHYEGTDYFIRYFQFDGNGSLRLYDEKPYLPNDLYPLPTEQFRLYYTSESNTMESFDVWISDNFDNERQVSFRFNNSQ